MGFKFEPSNRTTANITLKGLAQSAVERATKIADDYNAEHQTTVTPEDVMIQVLEKTLKPIRSGKTPGRKKSTKS